MLGARPDEVRALAISGDLKRGLEPCPELAGRDRDAPAGAQAAQPMAWFLDLRDTAVTMLARAGFKPSEFWPSRAHAGFISAARDSYASAFQVVPTPTAVSAGDIICATRSDTRLTPADIGLIGPHGPAMHCDIVVQIDAASRVAHAIGGNVQQTVARTIVPLNEAGELEFDAASARPWILALRARRFMDGDGAAFAAE